MQIFVGSTNPVKINAATIAASETWPEVMVQGFDVTSGVNEQPITDQETKQGAINRAKQALAKGLSLTTTNKSHSQPEVLGMGLEGGVFTDEADQMWTTVWGAVVDKNKQTFLGNGARFKVPKLVAQEILAGGEMGPFMADYCQVPSLKTREGLIGIVTNNFVDRTEEYAAIAKLVLGLWYGQDWQKNLK
jgi:inosine/xanthosine triphosphatase